LTATDLEDALLWRADFRSAGLKSLAVGSLHWAAVAVAPDQPFFSDQEIVPWSKKDYLSLRKEMEREIPAGKLRTIALERLEILDCDKKSGQLAPCDPKAAPPPIAKIIEKAAVDKLTYAKALASSLCTAARF
jgi:hypothetical protein